MPYRLLCTIIFNFNNTGVVRGCIILLPSKFEGRKQIELANERMSVLSPLFDFLIVVNPQKLSREFVKMHNINGFEAFYDELWKEVATLTAIVHSSKSLDEVRRNWEKDKSSKALLQGGALYIIRDKDIDFTIDKKTLQQIWHESNVFPEAAIEDIVNLHRLELPVTEENLTQMASYRNLTHQLTEGITAVAESLNSTLQGLTTNGEIEQAATIYGHILELLIPGEENPEAQRATVQFPDPEQTETVLQPGEPMSQTKEAIAHTDTAVTKGTPEASKTMLPTQEMIVEGTKPEDAAEVVLKLLKQGMATKDTALLRSVLQNFKIAGLPGELLQDAWSIRPEDVESSEKVEELYQKLGKQLKSLAGLLEENGQSSSNAFQAVTNLSRNVDFLQQINQTYAYIQLPLHLRQGEHKTGELFVYTNKKNLAGRDGRVSALLHLDMEHLGPLDVYVALQDTKVSTKFYVQNDTILDYLEANMEVLTQRLKQRGYDCNCETTLRTELQQTAQAMAPILKAGGSVPVAQYAFDVRT